MENLKHTLMSLFHLILSPCLSRRTACVHNWNSRISLANFREDPSGREQRIFAPRSRRRFAFLRAKTRKGDRGPIERGIRAGAGRKKKKSNRGLAWWIDDASKINVNTTKLVPAVFARGNGISVFTNSIDNISSFSALFSLSPSFSLSLSSLSSLRPTIRSLSWETRSSEIIGFRGLNYFLLSTRASKTIGKERRTMGMGLIGARYGPLPFLASPPYVARVRSCETQVLIPWINPFDTRIIY